MVDIFEGLLYKEKNQDPDNTLVELIVAKFRNGKTGSLAFEWHGENFRFVPTANERLLHIKKAQVKDDEEKKESTEGGNEE